MSSPCAMCRETNSACSLWFCQVCYMLFIEKYAAWNFILDRIFKYTFINQKKRKANAKKIYFNSLKWYLNSLQLKNALCFIIIFLQCSARSDCSPFNLFFSVYEINNKLKVRCTLLTTKTYRNVRSCFFLSFVAI